MLIYTRHSSLSENTVQLKARILTVSTYMAALKTWHMLIEAQGYEAISFLLTNGLENLCMEDPFDVIIIGQSVDDAEKKELVEIFRQCSSAPIVSVPSTADEPTDGADLHTESDPEELLRVIASLVQSGRVPRGRSEGKPEQVLPAAD